MSGIPVYIVCPRLSCTRFSPPGRPAQCMDTPAKLPCSCRSVSEGEKGGRTGWLAGELAGGQMGWREGELASWFEAGHVPERRITLIVGYSQRENHRLTCTFTNTYTYIDKWKHTYIQREAY